MKAQTNCLASLLIFVSAFVSTSCNKPEEIKTGTHVSGVLTSNGTPIANAMVNIDGLKDFQATSDASGYFEIKNVPKGKHSITAYKSDSDDSFIKQTYNIDIDNEDFVLKSFLLPNPVLIESITLDSITNIATLVWNKSTAEDFREYKLYRHSTSGLDESTGTLEYVTIDANDTAHQIQLKPASNEHFRVFVLNEYGQLGGSNIKDINSKNINLIEGGKFNSPSDLVSWSIDGNIGIDNIDSYEGSGSLLLNSEVDTVDNNLVGYVDRWPISKNVLATNINVEKDRDYTITFRFKFSGFGYMSFPLRFYFYQNNEEKIETTVYEYNMVDEWIPRSPFGMVHDMDWAYYSKSFTSDSDNIAVFTIETQVDKVWIDNLEIKVTE